MSRVGLQEFVVVAVYLGMAACATLPPPERARIADIPLVSIHSDIAFTISTSARQDAACDDATACPPQEETDAALRFALQVRRIAGVLQIGVTSLQPDLARRFPASAGRRFDVYVVEGDALGSASSANGRIALNEAFARLPPYDEVLAFVIAREMGHVIARHHEENSAASIAASAILTVLIPGSGMLKTAISAAGSGLAARSKEDAQALEADAIALGVLRAAGFRLRDVSLSLRSALALPDDGRWSKRFRTSSDNLLAEALRTEFAVASAAASPAWQRPAAGTDR